MHYKPAMNLGSKLKQGCLNLLNNEKQLLSAIRNVSNISRIRSTIKRNLKKKDVPEYQSFHMKKDKRVVQNVETCLEYFDVKPLKHQTLFCIHFSQQLCH